MKLIRLLICVLLYPIGMSYAMFVSLRRWFRNFDMSEVHSCHRDWKELVTEALHPGHCAWAHRKRIANMCNQEFTEPEP